MDDFIFGTLDTESQRLRYYRECRKGFFHGGNRSPLDPFPNQPVTLTVWVGSSYYPLDGWIYYTIDGSDPIGEKGRVINGQVIKLKWVSSHWDDLTWGYYHLLEGTLPGQKDQTVVRYRISIILPNDSEVFADQGAYYAYAVDNFTPPAWVEEAVIYHIFVDRFAKPKGETWNNVKSIEDIYGGNLRGILDRLDYLQQLGINTLYLSPIFPSTSHHRYDATDYFNVDPVVGSKDDLIRLLDALHRHGMRLILDFVPNHWSSQHPTFRQAVSDPNSPFRSWYTFLNYPNQYECFFNVPGMPKVNLRDVKARAYMIEAARYWLKLGVDGFRIDHAVGPTPDFWADFRIKSRQVNPDAWIIGEVVESPNTQLQFCGLLDGCLDFLLLEALRQTFTTGQWTTQQLASFLAGHYSLFPQEFHLASFLDNHDMDRFIWAARGDIRKLKMAALCQFSLPGIPMIYYGTEVGLSQTRGIREKRGGFGRLEEARLPMLWDESQDKGLFEFYQGLIRLRREQEPLLRGKIFIQSATSNTLTFIRETKEKQLLVALNISEKPQSISLEQKWGRVVLTTHTNISYPNLKSLGIREILLPAFSGAILCQNEEL